MTPFMPLMFKAEAGEVLFDGRAVSPAKRAAIKSALLRMGDQTEDLPTLRFLDGVYMQLIAASVAAVNQTRAAMRVVSNNQPHRAA